ncbi:MAG: hypothetical protein ABIP71_00870, partial [Verrucomicrobiota bacterium]
KPLRVMNDRVNIKIVLAERGSIEAGFYVSQPISSFAPGKEYFLEQVLLSEPEDKAFGTLYRYKLAEKAQTNSVSQSKRQRFIPQKGTELKTSWSVMDKPSMLNPKGWAIMAHMT